MNTVWTCYIVPGMAGLAGAALVSGAILIIAAAATYLENKYYAKWPKKPKKSSIEREIEEQNMKKKHPVKYHIMNTPFYLFTTMVLCSITSIALYIVLGFGQWIMGVIHGQPCL